MRKKGLEPHLLVGGGEGANGEGDKAPNKGFILA